MRSTYLSVLALAVFFLDGWGSFLAMLLVLGIHSGYFSMISGDFYLGLLVMKTRKELAADLHAEASAAIVLAMVEKRRTAVKIS